MGRTRTDKEEERKTRKRMSATGAGRGQTRWRKGRYLLMYTRRPPAAEEILVSIEVIPGGIYSEH